MQGLALFELYHGHGRSRSSGTGSSLMCGCGGGGRSSTVIAEDESISIEMENAPMRRPMLAPTQQTSSPPSSPSRMHAPLSPSSPAPINMLHSVPPHTPDRRLMNRNARSRRETSFQLNIKRTTLHRQLVQRKLADSQSKSKNAITTTKKGEKPTHNKEDFPIDLRQLKRIRLPSTLTPTSPSSVTSPQSPSSASGPSSPKSPTSPRNTGSTPSSSSSGGGGGGGLAKFYLDFRGEGSRLYTYKMKIASNRERDVWINILSAYAEYREYGRDEYSASLNARPHAPGLNDVSPSHSHHIQLQPYFAYAIPSLYRTSIESCLHSIRVHDGYRVERLFRSGSTDYALLRRILLCGGSVEEALESGGSSGSSEGADEPNAVDEQDRQKHRIQCLAFCAKHLLRTLPETLLTNALFPTIFDATKSNDLPLLIRLVHFLPPSNQRLLQSLFELIYLTISSPSSMMSIESMSKVVGPNLLPLDDEAWLRAMTMTMTAAPRQRGVVDGDAQLQQAASDVSKEHQPTSTSDHFSSSPSSTPSVPLSSPSSSNSHPSSSSSSSSSAPAPGSIPMHRFFELVLTNGQSFFPNSHVFATAAAQQQQPQQQQASLQLHEHIEVAPELVALRPKRDGEGETPDAKSTQESDIVRIHMSGSDAPAPVAVPAAAPLPLPMSPSQVVFHNASGALALAGTVAPPFTKDEADAHADADGAAAKHDDEDANTCTRPKPHRTDGVEEVNDTATAKVDDASKQQEHGKHVQKDQMLPSTDSHKEGQIQEPLVQQQMEAQ